MKKASVFIIMLFLSVCSAALAEEQDTQSPDMQRPEMRQEGPAGERPGRAGANKMGMKSGPMAGMHPTVVATSDGGVVVLAGGKLTKFDSSLTLINEIELKGGPKTMDKKAETIEIKRPPLPPQEELTDQTSPEIAASPAPEGDSAYTGPVPEGTR